LIGPIRGYLKRVDEPLKICLVTNLYHPYSIGGAEFYAKWLTKVIMRHGHQPFVVTTCPPRESFPKIKQEIIDGVPVYRFYPLNIYWGYLAQRKPLFLKPFWHTIELWNPHVYWVFKHILAKELPDIVHVNNMGGLSNAIFWASKGRDRKVVYTLHDYLSLCPKSILLKRNMNSCIKPSALCSLYQWIKRWNLRNTVDRFTAPSRFVLDLHQRYNLIDQSRSTVIPHGVELNGDDLDKVARWRDGYERTANIHILYIGKVEVHKGLSTLVRAFKMANRKDLHLHIAGTGDYLDRAKRELSGSENVTFHGWVSGLKKRDLFWNSDVCVLPSICYEAAGLVILEAYRYGLPVIGSRIGGIPEIVRQDHTGFLFESGDGIGLSSIFKQISKGRLRSMAANCRHFAESHSLEKHGEKLMAVYANLVNKQTVTARGCNHRGHR
jgi:glycosyltransferase involved in cell wall biosynthesis